MPEKKKTPASRSTERRMSRPQGPELTESSAAGAVPTRDATNSPQRTNAQRQLADFESAMKLFHARKLHEARELFGSAAAGPERDVAQRARLHISMCDRRLESSQVNLGTAEEHYNYGIALINTRKLRDARQHLEKALQITPNADHVHYALALAEALDGDPLSAFENLKKAIELEPRNRMIARQDADFAPLLNQPPFDALFHPDKKSW
jgi:tetratricopeptide (TPR) repeat protein